MILLQYNMERQRRGCRKLNVEFAAPFFDEHKWFNQCFTEASFCILQETVKIKKKD